jgi:SH3-like domain-containing protein
MLALGLMGPAPVAGEAARGPVTNLPLPRYVSTRAEEVNVRRGPSLGQRIDWTFVRRGSPLQVTDEYGNWRRVRDAEGAGGWVHQSLLSGVRTVLVQAPERVILRAGASEGAAVRAVLEPGVVARLEGCDPDWCQISVEAVEGWAPRTALWGVDPDETFD